MGGDSNDQRVIFYRLFELQLGIVFTMVSFRSACLKRESACHVGTAV